MSLLALSRNHRGRARRRGMLNPSMGGTAFMTQSLITGIKRGSPMLIDNTGITLKLGRPRSIRQERRKSVNELAAQERSIAICLRWKVVAHLLTGGRQPEQMHDQ